MLIVVICLVSCAIVVGVIYQNYLEGRKKAVW